MYNLLDFAPAITQADFYKTGHHIQYPDNTKTVVTNLTPRMTRIGEINEVTLFGPQMYIKKWLMGQWEEFFKLDDTSIDTYEAEVRLGLNDMNYSADHFRALKKLGYLPLEIRALPEGSQVPIRIPCLTIHNTHDDFYWLPNFLETQMSAEIWLPCTSASIALQYRKVFEKYCEATGGIRELVPGQVMEMSDLQGHDFSMRGMGSVWDACKSGAAHLLSFLGTDTIPAILYLRSLYGGVGYIGGSVPATEHSVMQSGGTDLATIDRLLDLYPTGILSVVCDTWDFWNVVTVILPQLKDKIMAREGTLVIRPDSGDPADIICGTPKGECEASRKGLIECLWDTFGGTTNDKGFQQLDSHIGAIYGDSITLERQTDILERLMQKMFASTNIVLGIGSFTYQYVTRDTFGFALKATWAAIGDRHVPLFKKPKTDDGTKNSAKGLVFVEENNGVFTLHEDVSWERFISSNNALELIYRDGKLFVDHTLDEIKARMKDAIARSTGSLPV
tara:strand:- start:10118 stop:11629 length:1512 start_codon:yes stop_codon:yes gene_type:complete